MLYWDEDRQEWVEDDTAEAGQPSEEVQTQIPERPPIQQIRTDSMLGGGYAGDREGVLPDKYRARQMARAEIPPPVSLGDAPRGGYGDPQAGSGPYDPETSAMITGYGTNLMLRKAGNPKEQPWLTPGGEMAPAEYVQDIESTMGALDRGEMSETQLREKIKRQEGIVPPGRRPSDGEVNIVDFVNFHMSDVEPKLREQAKAARKQWEGTVSYSTRSLNEAAFDSKGAAIEEKMYNELRNEEKALATKQGERLQRLEDEKKQSAAVGFSTDNRTVSKNPKTGQLMYSDTREPYSGGPLKPITDANAGNKIPDINATTGTTPPGVRNDAALDGLSAGQAATVKGLVDYTIPLPSGMALRNPEWQAMLGRAALYDTSFDAKEYATRLSLKRDFTTGNAAKNARSLNTTIHHLETLKKEGEALQNRSLQWWNWAANNTLEKLGDARPTKYLNAATALSGELANVFKNTSGTDQEIKAWRENISVAQSPEQINGNADTVIQLIAGRLAALTNQYEKGMGKPKDFTLLSERSRQILSKLGAKVDDLDPVSESKGGVKASSQGQRTIIERRKTASGKILTKYSDGSIE